MMAAPRCYTVGTKAPLSQASSFTASGMGVHPKTLRGTLGADAPG